MECVNVGRHFPKELAGSRLFVI